MIWLSDTVLLDPIHSVGFLFLFLKVVKVWDFDSGKRLFEFCNAHGNSAITCLTFDPSGRRYVSKCQHWKILYTCFLCVFVFFHVDACTIMMNF